MSPSPYSKAALKRGGWHFLSGKAATALLTFLILLGLVRLLPIADYAAYVTFAAALELAYPVAGIGLPWLASRYLPEYRLNATGRRVRQAVWALLACMTAMLAAAAAALAAGLDAYLGWADLARYRTAAGLFLVLFVVEYGCRFVRENLLGPLMQQAWVRASQVVRQAGFGALLLLQARTGSTTLADVVAAELAAASLGALIAVAGLWRQLHLVRGQAGRADWSAPGWRQMGSTAGNMYAARLMTLPYSPQALVLLIQRMLSPDAVALFGFLRSLYVQISNNLPATLLFSLIQPKLVASYVRGGVDELTRNANLAGKLSLFVLTPLLAASAVGGEPLVALASGSKFADSGYLFLGFILVLVPFSQRLLLETVAVASGHSVLCTIAASSGFVVLPVLWILVQLGWGLWAPIATLALGYWLFNLIVQGGLARRTEYRPDVRGNLKLLLAAAAGALATWPLISLPAGIPALLAVAAVATVGCLLTAWFVKPFSQAERDVMNTLFNRRFFVW